MVAVKSTTLTRLDSLHEQVGDPQCVEQVSGALHFVAVVFPSSRQEGSGGGAGAGSGCSGERLQGVQASCALHFVAVFFS